MESQCSPIGVAPLFMFLFLFVSMCWGAGKTIKVRSGKYVYETVEGDPLKTRIYQLENGLKIYLTVNKNAPRIYTAIPVRAGSKHDPPDATGLAHYLEHMLFKGTDDFGTIDYEREKIEIEKLIDLFEQYRQTTDSGERQAIYQQINDISAAASRYAIANEYDKMLASIGARGTNAFTSVEQTVYVNDIPNNQFEKWVAIETERFQDPVMRLFQTELEAVYEEKNRSLDSDSRKVSDTLNAALFQKHPYGTQTTIGTIEHLINPSIKKVIEYYDTYYVPNNMALCLSGDFEPDKMIQVIDHNFGRLLPKAVPQFTPPIEDPITRPIIKEVWGPAAESVSIGFRLPGVLTPEADFLLLVDFLIMNHEAGLIDLNLNQKQKVLDAYTYVRSMKDYSAHIFSARPREGQSLDEIKALLLSQLALIKKGEFPEWLLPAIIKNLLLGRMYRYESNRLRVASCVEAFIFDMPWEDYVYRLERLSRINHRDIVEFANKYYQENYVVVFKRTGEDKNVQKITRPDITPVKINRTHQSKFVRNILNTPAPEIQPVFLDFKTAFESFSIKNQIDGFYLKNIENEIFHLNFILDWGTNHHKKLGIALSYLPYLGTTDYSPEEIRQAFYRLGSSFSVSSSSERMALYLTGLAENFEASLALFEQLLRTAQPNPATLKNLIKDIRKKRADKKLSKTRILWNAMYNFGIFGAHSPFTNILNDDELNALTPEELIEILKTLTQLPHRIQYYGPADKEQVEVLLNQYHQVPTPLLAYPEPEVFEQLPTTENKVYVVNYTMKQVEIILLSKSELYNKNKAAVTRLFNEYYGSNMSSVVFQELRESQALAYSVFAAYQTPGSKEKAHYVFAYIGTQAEKLGQAMKGLFQLLNKMPESELSFKASIEAILKKIQSERITRTKIFDYYENARRLGFEYDLREDIYEQVPRLKMDAIRSFFNDYVQGNQYTILVLGDLKKLDRKILKKYGQLQILSLEEIFGY